MITSPSTWDRDCSGIEPGKQWICISCHKIFWEPFGCNSRRRSFDPKNYRPCEICSKVMEISTDPHSQSRNLPNLSPRLPPGDWPPPYLCLTGTAGYFLYSKGKWPRKH